MTKKELLEQLLKAQKEGKVEDRNLIAKVEMLPEAAVEKSDDEYDEPDPVADHMKSAAKKFGATHAHAGTFEMGGADHDDDPIGHMKRFAKWHARHMAAGHQTHITEHSNPDYSEYPIGVASAWKAKKKK